MNICTNCGGIITPLNWRDHGTECMGNKHRLYDAGFIPATVRWID